MRDQQGHIDELDRVQDTKSASRFSLYELKAMSKQGDIGGFWRIIFPVQRSGKGDAAHLTRPGMQFEGAVRNRSSKPSPFSNVAMKGIYLLW